EPEPGQELLEYWSGDLALAALEHQLGEDSPRLRHGHRRDVRDRAPAEPDAQRRRVEPRAAAFRAELRRLIALDDEPVADLVRLRFQALEERDDASELLPTFDQEPP